MRNITEYEKTWLGQLSAASQPKPPWTKENRDAREARNDYICRLYSEGVPVIEIADGADLSKHAIVAVVRKARSEGKQVVRPRARASADTEAYRRPLTDDEVRTLTELDGRIPRSRNNRRFLWGPEGEALREELRRLRNDRVALRSLAKVLGISRQSVHVMTKAKVEDAVTEQVNDTETVLH